MSETIKRREVLILFSILLCTAILMGLLVIRPAFASNYYAGAEDEYIPIPESVAVTKKNIDSYSITKPMAAEYQRLISQYQDNEQLIYTNLIDFDRDGYPELVLCVVKVAEDYSYCDDYYLVYGTRDKGKSVVCLCNHGELADQSGSCGYSYLVIMLKNDIPYIMDCQHPDHSTPEHPWDEYRFYTLSTLKDGMFQTVHSVEGLHALRYPGDGVVELLIDPKIDGSPCSEQEYNDKVDYYYSKQIAKVPVFHPDPPDYSKHNKSVLDLCRKNLR